MKKNALLFLTLFFLPLLPAAEKGSLKPMENPWEKTIPATSRGPVDHLLFASWKKHGVAIPREASDSVLIRRWSVALAGRIPTPEEAKKFVRSSDPGKYEKYVDSLLASEGFIDHWTLHFADILRVKSEFPINLWPNAVYVYTRRIRSFLEKNEPYDQFVTALLTSSGSNFRRAEVNFFRANADRSPAGMAAGTLLSLQGRRWKFVPEPEKKLLISLFESIGFKDTREWKEQIVFRNVLPPRRLELPDGEELLLASGDDPFPAYARYLVSNRNGYFSRAAVSRVWYWFFGRGLTEPADDLRPDNPVVHPELMNFLAKEFERSGYNFRQLVRRVALCAAARTAAERAETSPEARRLFAAFPVRRLGAEVLDDILRDLTGTPGNFSSVIPEPFTYIPPEMRSVSLADGSISSTFLILFGRPARDTGELEERGVSATAKQRLYLFNSGNLYNRIRLVARRPELKKLPFQPKFTELYWLFFSRPPTQEEQKILFDSLNNWPEKRSRWRFMQELCWVLLNTREFLYQH